MHRPRAIYVLSESSLPLIYGPAERGEIARLADVYAPPQTPQSIAADRSLLNDAEILISGWGAPVLDETFLEAAPALRAVLYGAGSLAHLLTPAVWERQLQVSSACVANAIPVAEYALGAILLSLKQAWPLARATREQQRFVPRDGAPGAYRSTVGLISLGAIGRHLLKLLRNFDVDVAVYDPFLSVGEAVQLGVKPMALDEVFARAHVVSLHAPLLAETVGMVTGAHLSSMRPGAAFVNTARATIVRQAELIAVATARPDLQFILDVADPEPPEPDSPLYALPNVFLTPHLAGSVGPECRRMGRYMVDELERYVAGRPLRWAVTRASSLYSSHRPASAQPAAALAE